MVDAVLGSSFVVASNPTLLSAIQDRTLVRVFRDSLFPRLLYRAEAGSEIWPANLGDNQTFTRSGLMRPTTRPLVPGQDPKPKTWNAEQWEVSAQQWGDSIDTHMPTNYTSLASTYLRNMHQLGLHAGQSINRVVRDRIFNAYCAGNTVVRIAVGAGVTVPVVSLLGFTKRLFNGRPTPVSPTNPLPIVIISGGVPTNFNVVGFTSDFAGDEIHSGVLTLSAAHAGLAARDIVLAVNRSQVINSGGSVSIDGIASGDHFTMADIRSAVAQLRTNNVPTHEDGQYHCHLDPTSESQIFGDNEFQRLNQSLPDFVHYREMALAKVLGTVFYRNTEAPTLATVDQDPEFGFTFGPELVNVPSAGSPVEIHRPFFSGQGYLEEKRVPEEQYISEAGIQGKIGEFAITNNGIAVMTEGIRLILRAPQDRLQQQTASSWSISGGWALPTDAESKTSPADYKRGVVVQHGA